MQQHEIQFREFMAACGVVTEAVIPDDGTLCRFHVQGDKPGTRNGWAVLFGEGVPAGCFGHWRTGVHRTWSAKRPHQMTPEERQQQKANLQRARAKRERQQRERYQWASQRAMRLWINAVPADPGHAYLNSKSIQPHLARQLGSSLVMLLQDISGNPWSLQFIAENGEKRLLAGGRKKGCFILVGNPEHPERVRICEGFATGATLAEQDSAALVLAAVDASNLVTVALAVRQKWPRAELLICGDDDRLTAGNPGVSKASEAAYQSQAMLELPQWPPGAPLHLTDFNDLACWLRQEVA